MGEIVLKIPQKIDKSYSLTERYAAQILAELDLKSEKLKPNPADAEKLADLKALMDGYRRRPDASVRRAIKTGERLRKRWNRK